MVAAAVGALLAAPALVAVSAPAVALEDNPFVGAGQYINPDWADLVEAAAAEVGDAGVAADMQAVADQPTSVWMDRIAAIEGTERQHGLEWHLDQADAQSGGSPLVFNVVIYDLPGRDCHALASNGELPATAAGMQRYKTEYIDPIAALLNQPEYENLRIVATIEPDSLPNLVTNQSDADCVASAPYYREGVQYALTELYEVGNVYSYIDAGHSGWLGWPNNSSGAAQEFANVIEGATYGWSAVSGFITNTANTTPLEETFLPNPELQVGGSPIKSAGWFEWNPDFDEARLDSAPLRPDGRAGRALQHRDAHRHRPQRLGRGRASDGGQHLHQPQHLRERVQGGPPEPPGRLVQPVGRGHRRAADRHTVGPPRVPPRRLRVGEAPGRVGRFLDRDPERRGQATRPHV